jgi:multidrug resistance efflux pump
MKFINKFQIAILLLSSTNIIAKQMNIYAQVSAKITFIAPIKSKVKKGDILIKLDNKIISYRLEELKSKVNLKKLFYDDANKNYLQDKILFDKTVISQRDLDISSLKNYKTKYEYEEQLAILKRYEEKYKLYTILAPDNCTVISIPNKINATNIYNAKILIKIKIN